MTAERAAKRDSSYVLGAHVLRVNNVNESNFAKFATALSNVATPTYCCPNIISEFLRGGADCLPLHRLTIISIYIFFKTAARSRTITL